MGSVRLGRFYGVSVCNSQDPPLSAYPNSTQFCKDNWAYGHNVLATCRVSESFAAVVLPIFPTVFTMDGV